MKVQSLALAVIVGASASIGAFAQTMPPSNDTPTPAVEEGIASLSVTEQVQLVYVGLLGRAADRSGLAYWTDAIANDGFTLEQLRANIVAEQPEFLESLGQMTRGQMVVQLYLNLFGRAPDEAGFAYWVSGDGAAVSADRLVLALVQGALNADVQTIVNRAAAATYYTSNYVTFDADVAGRVVTTAKDTPGSLEASIALTDDNVANDPNANGDEMPVIDEIRFAQFVRDQFQTRGPNAQPFMVDVTDFTFDEMPDPNEFDDVIANSPDQ